MATGMTTTTELKHTDLVKYNKALLYQAEDYCMYDKYGTNYTMKNKEGERAKWRRIPNLPEGTVLADGVNPTPIQLSKEDIYADLVWYGLVVSITDRVELTTQDDIYGAASKVLGRSAAKTRDSYTRGILAAGTNIFRGGAVAADSDIVTKVSSDDLDRVLLGLQNGNAEYYRPKIPASSGINTSPIADAYFVLTTWEVCRDLKNVLGDAYTPSYKYATLGGLERNEHGAYGNLRFIASSNGEIEADAGGTAATNSLAYTTAETACDLHSMIFLSKEAYGFVSLTAHNPRMIIKSAKEVGGALEVYGTAGYKMAIASKILDDAKMAVLKVGVSA